MGYRSLSRLPVSTTSRRLSTSSSTAWTRLISLSHMSTASLNNANRGSALIASEPWTGPHGTQDHKVNGWTEWLDQIASETKCVELIVAMNPASRNKTAHHQASRNDRALDGVPIVEAAVD